MNIVCLDLEGVLIPEIWVEFARETGITELQRTTQDEPDYDKLMRFRLETLERHGFGMSRVQETIGRIEPFPGAKEFLDKLRAKVQTVVLSDTFEEFAQPIMKKLDMPLIFCNSLEVKEDRILRHIMRVENSKYTTVKALHQMGYETICSGDSYNDLGMIRASKAGFLFRAPEKIRKENPDLICYEEYEELYTAICGAIHKS